MARFSRLEVLNTIIDTGLVPVFYNADVEVAKQVVQACAAGGARVVEFTNRGDFAPEVFKELAQYVSREAPHIILGVGSVIDEPTAAMYIAYGANFVVGPVLNEAVARLCNRRKVAYSPGCGSASEISRAEELGVEIVKIFPGRSVGGPDFVKAVLGPCPWTRIMPTGGVDATEESIQAWFGAGVACVGMGSKLIRKDLVAAGDWEGIRQKVEQVLQWIREARGEPLFLGVEHVGLYPTAEASAQAIGAWYRDRFGFDLKEGRSSFFVSGGGSGRIEIMKEALTDRCHVAVRVSNFEKAVEALKAQGVEFEEPKIKPGVKAVFLKERDPAGNLVHLLWTG
ncbi:MAG: bifunctional 4-hydroxy-2-oxoglutarate aldolase/2-dehydro-3-deoxy-phosphogluconate aldolase [Anaerolineae bacterium]|nr:bifunctional 4-hydroxy-2-oxoglutarate aldolase/2-dehydro-3-deoxy-phosphogluconate aldolase [Anaerolineae bacterium]